MTENERFRVFKYPDCKEFGVSDDVADCTLARFDYYFEAELLCDILNGLNDENQKLKDKLCKLGVSDVKGIDIGLEDWLND